MGLVHSFCMFQAFSIGWFSCVATCSWENFFAYVFETDGFDFSCDPAVAAKGLDILPGVDPLDPFDQCISAMHPGGAHATFMMYLLNFTALGFFVAIEIGALMVTCTFWQSISADLSCCESVHPKVPRVFVVADACYACSGSKRRADLLGVGLSIDAAESVSWSTASTPPSHSCSCFSQLPLLCSDFCRPSRRDRAFVADSLVRAAFEMGNPENPVAGVDPQRETSASGKIRLALMMLLYRVH